MSFITQPGHPKVWYEERPGSQKFSYVGNTPKLTREFRCDWQDRWRFIRALMGGAELKAIETAQPYVARLLPHAYQDFTHFTDDRPILYCTSIDEVAGVGPTKGDGVLGPKRRKVQKTISRGNDPALYSDAFVRATYEAPTYHVAVDKEVRDFFPQIHVDDNGQAGQVKPSDGDYRRYVTKIVQPAVEVIRLPVGFYSWAEGIEQDGVVRKGWGKGAAFQNITGSFRIKAFADITYVWHMVPALPKTGWLVEDVDDNNQKVNPETIGAVYTHLGCVNSAWFDGHPPGTLLCKGAEAKPYRWVDGQRYYDYTFHCQHFQPIDNLEPGVVIRDRPATAVAGHNHFLRMFNVVFDFPNAYYEPSHFMLLTHNGQRNGKPIFQYRDFNDLFTPFNRAHLIQYYTNTDVGP